MFPHILTDSNIPKGQSFWQIILFFIHIFICILFLLGIKSNLNCFFCWLLYISLHSRNMIILHGGDALLRMILFYFTFLPIGEYFSIDSLTRDPHKPRQKHCKNLISAGYILQYGIMYLFNFINKNGSFWREDYSAVFYVLQMEYFQLPMALFILSLNLPKIFFQYSTFSVSISSFI